MYETKFVFGGNSEVRKDSIWNVAQRNNKKPRQVIVRKVEKYKRVGVN